MASKWRPSAPARSRSSAAGARSQGMWSDTAGVARLSCWITAQSSSFWRMPRGSPGPGNRAKRVPPVPTPQEGTATVKAATAAVTASMSTPALARRVPSAS